MSTDDFTRRARNALLGLALGDALSWPSMFHRSRLLPDWTRRLRREIDAQRDGAGVLRVPLPFSMSQPAELLHPFPTDDSEWAAWMMKRLLRAGALVTEEMVIADWQELAGREEKILGGVSTQAALENIRRGILPPASGRENPHYFDDGALCRAVPIGIAYPGHPGAAIRAAEREAAATNSEDGIWTAGAMAGAVSAACAGAGPVEALEAALHALPEYSWARRIATEALLLPRRDVPRLDFVLRLQGIANVEYSDGCASPESLALILAIIACEGGNFHDALLLSLALPRNADVVPAIVASISGALADGEPIPAGWPGELDLLRGICLPSLAGENYSRIVDEFIAACRRNFTVRDEAT